jgi:plasmid stability protein
MQMQYIYESAMSLLQVRDMPEDLYEKLARVAKQSHRSIAQETIVLLKKALHNEESHIHRRQRILNEIKENKIEDSSSFPDPADLVREDRDR